MAPDLLFGATTAAVVPLQRLTQSIPIVFAQVGDPVALGLVANLAQPGGNITGFAVHDEETFIGKRLELLKLIAPGVSRVAILYDPANPQISGYRRVIESVARPLGLWPSAAPVRERPEIESAIDAFAREPSGSLLVIAGPITTLNREAIIAAAARHRLPAMYSYRYFVESGGLASYGADNLDLYRRAAAYVDRILKGAKPAELPVQQPTKYGLVINLGTAKAG
jgi:putative ABC transport system substrate-binding protein